MDRTLQERSPCWLGLFAGHAAHGAGACRALCVEAEFRHRGQPGHHARTCPLNRQGRAAAAHPHACFSKGCSSTASCTPLQHLWGSKAHTQGHTRTHNAHTHTHTNTNAREYSQARTRMYKCTRTNTQTHTRAHIQTLKHTGTQIHTHISVSIKCFECVANWQNQQFAEKACSHLILPPKKLPKFWHKWCG